LSIAGPHDGLRAVDHRNGFGLMLVRLLKSKLHCARVTDAKLHYQGSLAVDSRLMDAVGLSSYEHVLVADVDNGSLPTNMSLSPMLTMAAGSRHM
jgi:hypothetical protein